MHPVVGQASLFAVNDYDAPMELEAIFERSVDRVMKLAQMDIDLQRSFEELKAHNPNYNETSLKLFVLTKHLKKRMTGRVGEFVLEDILEACGITPEETSGEDLHGDTQILINGNIITLDAKTASLNKTGGYTFHKLKSYYNVAFLLGIDSSDLESFPTFTPRFVKMEPLLRKTNQGARANLRYLSSEKNRAQCKGFSVSYAASGMYKSLHNGPSAGEIILNPSYECSSETNEKGLRNFILNL